MNKLTIDKIESGSKKALLGTLMAYGTAALMKELDKSFKGEDNAQRREERSLQILFGLLALFRVKMETGNERGKLNEETEYEDFEGLKHYVYAGFKIQLVVRN